MPSSFVVSHLRRTNRNLLLTNIALLACCAAVLGASGGAIAAMVRGPRRVSAAELARLARRADAAGTYITVRAEDVVEVGEKWEENESGERHTVAKLQLAKVGDHALLVETEPDATERTLAGQLGAMTPQEHTELSALLRRENPEVLTMVLPVRLDATKNPWDDDGFIVALVLAGALFALWKIAQGVRRFRDPGAHPSMRALAAYGGMSANAKMIDAEVAAGPATFGRAMVTANWLVHPSAYALGAAPLAEVVWFYKRVVRHYHTFIPVGKTYSLVVHTRPAKRPMSIVMREQHLDKLLAELGARAPWAMAGYSKEREGAMAGPSRAQVVQEVQERRRQAKTAA